MANENDYANVLIFPNFTRVNQMKEVEERAAYVLGSQDIQTIDLPFALAVVLNKTVFELDPADTTTAHNGTTVLVSNDNKRFKSDVVGARLDSVLDRLATPPGSPASGDAYIITSPATDEFAGKEDDIGLFSLTDWLFITPPIGFSIFVRDELGFYHVKPDGTWASGLGVLQSVDGALSIAALNFAFGLPVEAEQNTPPVSPVDDTAYIVGTAPTDDFDTHNQEIALRRSGVWVFIDKYEGATVYDKNLSKPRAYNGSLWSDLVTPSIHIATADDNDATEQTFATMSTWLPTTDEAHDTGPAIADGEIVAQINHTMALSTNVLEFVFSASFDPTASRDGIFVALFVDSETTPRDWHIVSIGDIPVGGNHPVQAMFEVAIGDTAAHDYKLYAGLFDITVALDSSTDVKRTRFRLKELTP